MFLSAFMRYANQVHGTGSSLNISRVRSVFSRWPHKESPDKICGVLRVFPFKTEEQFDFYLTVRYNNKKKVAHADAEKLFVTD